MAKSKDGGTDVAVEAVSETPAETAPKMAETPAAEPVSKAALKTTKAKPPVAKRTTPAKRAASKPARKAPASRKAATPKVAKTTAAKKSAAVASKVKSVLKAPAKASIKITEEFAKMTTPEAMTKTIQDAMAEMTAKSKAAYEKSTSIFTEAGEFTKGNVEAVVESSKIFATGVQAMGRSMVADSKAEFEALTAEVKELAAVKSPTDFFQLQSAMMRKYFDKSVAAASKNTEAMLKLANDAAQPLSSRVSLAMEKVKAA